MASIRLYQDGPYEMVELADEASGSSFTVAPARGGIITSYVSQGQELFYLDRETFVNPDANIRGGNPILFPISGQLKDGAYTLDGRSYRMKNHGLARTAAWEVEEKGTDDAGFPYIRLCLTSTDEMLESYPFRFELRFTYSLGPGGELRIRQEYTNRSTNSMPVYAGFHPYFATAVKELAYETDATQLLDYNDGETKPFLGSVDLTPLTEAVALTDARAPRISFVLPDAGRRVTLEYSEVFRYVVLWTAAGKDFVCVEPWMALNGELHRGEELVRIPAGETLRADLTIRSSRE
ncbi:aldose epimerase [Gorillibacterium sp. sgz5001074]|uniref:aldose epimerase family protein n=1 Tax=Gorillibacterium sp. sgz5001074 TaxID=3446695 RepID=UPI003F66D9A6